MDQTSLAHLERAFRAAAFAYRRATRESEAKANFNPSQPRVPRGTPRGGEWTGGGGKPVPGAKEATEASRWFTDEQREDLDVAMRQHSRDVQLFIERNRDPITRLMGALQLAGGAGEMVVGVGGASAGVATSEVGLGIPLAAASAWMVTNGYDNFATGWRALTTGSPQETNLHRALRGMGLSNDQATATEFLLAGGAAAGAARLSNAALREAAQRGLERRALAEFAGQPLDVRAGAVRIWDEINIIARGDAWEAFDAARTGFRRTPSTFRVFDQVDDAFEVAVSNKTLDLAQVGYSRADRNTVYNTIAGYIDRVASFRRHSVGDFVIEGARLRERRLHLVLPSGEVLPGQALQIAAAEQYAATRGVVLQVEYAR